MKLTKKRKDILGVLKKTKKALTAQKLHESLAGIDLVTVYRNLDLFTKEGIVKKIDVGGEAQYEFQAHPHHHAICTDCDDVVHFDASNTAVTTLLRQAGFSAEGVDITIRGKCNKHA